MMFVQDPGDYTEEELRVLEGSDGGFLSGFGGLVGGSLPGFQSSSSAASRLASDARFNTSFGSPFIIEGEPTLTGQLVTLAAIGAGAWLLVSLIRKR